MTHSRIEPGPFEYWDLVNTAWKAAVTILVLRYLYFGRPALVPAIRTAPLRSIGISTSLNSDQQLDYTRQLPEQSIIEDRLDKERPDHPMASRTTADPFFCPPSPTRAPQGTNTPPSFELWDARFKLHTEASTILVSTLVALEPHLQAFSLRFALVPAIILGLVSRPNSIERKLCISYLSKFTGSMQHHTATAVGETSMGYDIPWNKLDAFSDNLEKHEGGKVATMPESAPEWNWWDMLKHIDLNLSCTYGDWL